MIFKKIILCYKGQALLETVLVLPIILMLIFGIVEFGRIYNSYIIISNASRDAARYAAVGHVEADVLQLINNRTIALDASKLVISITPQNTRIQGDSVTVTILYNMPLITPIVGPLISGTNTFNVKSATSMRIE